MAFRRRPKIKVKDGYKCFSIPKTGGGRRKIESPLDEYRKNQEKWKVILENRLKVSQHAHAFRQRRSIITNAAVHFGSSIVVALDFKDAYWQVNKEKVRGVLEHNNFSEEEIQEVIKWCMFEGRLPMGGLTSPVLFNAACFKLDCQLGGNVIGKGLAGAFNSIYTRYADNITFSSGNNRFLSRMGNNKPNMSLGKIIPYVRDILRDGGFELNDKKIHVIRPHRRMNLCGVVINSAVLKNQNKNLHPHKEFYSNLKVRLFQASKGYLRKFYALDAEGNKLGEHWGWSLKMMERIMEKNPEIYARKTYEIISEPYAYTPRDLQVDNGRISFIYSVNKEKAEKIRNRYFDFIENTSFIDKEDSNLPEEFWPERSKEVLDIPVANAQSLVEKSFT